MTSNPLRLMIVILLTLMAITTIAPLAWCADDPLASDLVHAALVADLTSIKPGEPFTIGVRLKIAPHWHIYWINPGDAGIPTTVKFDLPDGFTASPLQYPTPHRFEDDGIVAYGYTDEVMLLATITPPATIEVGSVDLGVTVKYLVCEKSCISGAAILKLHLLIGDGAKSSSQNEIAAWTARLPTQVSGYSPGVSHSSKVTPSATKINEARLQLTINWSEKPPVKLDWFPPASDAVAFNDVRVTTLGRQTTVTANIVRLNPQKPEKNGQGESVIGFDSIAERIGIIIPIPLTFQ